MTQHVVARGAAAEDVIEIREWYEAQSPGLGKSFLDELGLCFARIERKPETNAIVRGDVRKARTGRFPYHIFYRIRGREIRIVAEVHQSRDPRVWQKRVR